MTNPKIYDTHFNANEWIVLVAGVIGMVAVLSLPKRFPKKLSIVYFLCGMTFGSGFDLTLGAIPVSFYDVNDRAKVEMMDLMSIWVYGSVSYMFVYVYDILQLNPKWVPFYILVWAVISVGIEWIGAQIGVYHYDNGYGFEISFEIYLAVHTIWVAFFHFMQAVNERTS